MNFRVLVASAFAGCIVPTAFAQLSAIHPAQTKSEPHKIVVAPPDTRPSFHPLVGGSDSCATPDAISGSGPFSFNNTAATTGAEGQANASCLFFGTMGIGNDVWFTWTAGSSGNATLALCGGATMDSKVAVYNGSGCPGGAAIACNDDSCGLQSQVSFAVTNGSQYTVQLGNFPGAAPSSGTFTINIAGGGGGSPDSCGAAAALSGPGPYPFDNSAATTGAEGQANSNCLFFGTTGIANDVWFTWTAPSTGSATLDLCGLASMDSKCAVYAGAGCPGAQALACNDDSCGLQSSVSWSATSGAQYTIQLGNFPGAVGGTGSFRINIAGPVGPCDNHDDGSTENAIGLTAGGDLMWLQRFGAPSQNTTVAAISTAWGSPINPPSGNPTNGTPVKVTIYSDPDNDGNPTNAVLQQVVSGVLVGSGTDAFQTFLLAPAVTINGHVWVGAEIATAAGVFPAPLDQPAAAPFAGQAWIVGQTGGPPLNLTNLGANNVAPLDIASAGFAGQWLLRVTCAAASNDFCVPHTANTGPCPCTAGTLPGHGCNNSDNTGGALLTTAGTASLTADTLVFTSSGEKATATSVFLQSSMQQNGVVFGQGRLCLGGTLLRLYVKSAVAGVAVAPVAGDASVSARSAQLGDVLTAGSTRFHQVRYRDPIVRFPCDASLDTFNVSQGTSVTWAP